MRTPGNFVFLWLLSSLATMGALAAWYWAAMGGGVGAIIVACGATLVAVGPGMYAASMMAADINHARALAEAQWGIVEQNFAQAERLYVMEQALGADLDGDGTVGEPPQWDGLVNIAAQRKRVRGLLEGFIRRSWQVTLEKKQNPLSNATGLARANWVGVDVPEPYQFTREQHDDAIGMLGQLRLIKGRGMGSEGFFTVDSLEECLRVLHDGWQYVKIAPCWDQIAGTGPASQPAR